MPAPVAGAVPRTSCTGIDPMRMENAMNAGTLHAPRSDWSRYVPMLVALAVVWLCARGLKKSFWTLFGMYWAVRWMW
jgi:hypothetical protein